MTHSKPRRNKKKRHFLCNLTKKNRQTFTTHAVSRYRPTEGKTSSFPGLSVWFCRHVVTLLAGGTGPSQYLYLHRTTKMPKNASIHPCPEWDRTNDLVLETQEGVHATQRGRSDRRTSITCSESSSTMFPETLVGPDVSVVVLSADGFYRSLCLFLT